MPRKERKLSKNDFVEYCRQLYESRDPAERDFETFEFIIDTVLANKTGKVSVRTLKSYKAEHGWVKGKLASGAVVTVIRRAEKEKPKKPGKGPTLPAAPIRLESPAAAAPETPELREFSAYEKASPEMRRSLVRDIGERYFETGALPNRICREIGLPYGLFVQWTTESPELGNIWATYRTQRTLVVCEGLKGYIANVTQIYVERAFEPRVSITQKFQPTGVDADGEVIGVWVNESKKIEPPVMPSPAEMAALLDIVQKQESAAKAAIDGGRSETGAGDLDSQIAALEAQLSQIKGEME